MQVDSERELLCVAAVNVHVFHLLPTPTSKVTTSTNTAAGAHCVTMATSHGYDVKLTFLRESRTHHIFLQDATLRQKKDKKKKTK